MKQAQPQVWHGCRERGRSVAEAALFPRAQAPILQPVAGPAGCTLQAGQKGLPVLGPLVWLISSHLFASLPRQLNSKQRPGLHASGSKLGTCLFCLLWGTRKEQTAALCELRWGQSSLNYVCGWMGRCKGTLPRAGTSCWPLSRSPFHWIHPLRWSNFDGSQPYFSAFHQMFFPLSPVGTKSCEHLLSRVFSKKKLRLQLAPWE